jgi:phage shock protein A
MSRIWGIVVGLCAVVGVGAIIFHFSGARGDVAKKKILGQIDKWLGEHEVARADIDRDIKKMEEAVTNLTKASITARYQAEKLEKEVVANKKRIADSEGALTKLSGDLKKFESEPSYTVSYGGKTYNKKDDLEKMAQTVIASYKTLKKDNESAEKRLETFNTTASTLEARTADAKKKLAEMKNQLKELDNKIMLAKAQKEAAEALSESDKTFGDSVKGIEDKISKLDASAETAARMEDAKWKDLTAKTEVEDATAIINKTQSTSKEIDDLLGNK